MAENLRKSEYNSLTLLLLFPLELLYYLCISNSYTMECPTVRGDNTRALACGLSYVQVDNRGITILYYLHQCRPCTSRDVSCLSWQGWYKFV